MMGAGISVGVHTRRQHGQGMAEALLAAAALAAGRAASGDDRDEVASRADIILQL